MTDTEKTATLRDENLESGNSNQKKTKDENRKPENSIIVKKFLNAWESSPRGWHVIFLISCVIGVLIDPLFLYIPIINEDDKCLRRDESMKNIALIMRSTTDFAYILNIIVRFLSASKKAKEHKLSIWKGFPWWYLLTDILAILPFPQVVVVVFFSKMAGSKSLTSRKFLNILLLAQYVPRILRIYLSAKELGKNLDSLTRRLWVKGAFNFFLYIIAGHVFGAFWYFYSIFRETACWHHAVHACNSQNGCHSYSSFNCRSNSISTKNLTYFNQFCPVNPTNSTVFDFGIFVKAIESGTLGTTNFPRKFFKCFWWGLRNLSSLGSNLETSSNIWENLFAVLISMLGLLLFLYLIGNLQLESTKAEKARRKLIAIEPEIKSNLSNHGLPNNKVDVIMRYIGGIIRQDKELDVNPLLSLLDEVEGNKDHEQRERVAEFVIKTVNAKKLEKNTTYRWTELSKWISDNGIPDNRKQEIMQYMRVRLHEGKDVDVVNILGVLPHSLVKFVRKHLCLDTLKKVPMVKNKYGVGCEIICNYLKPVTYLENTYIIKKGEPLDMMLFITQVIVWSFNETSMECLQKGDYFGKELLEWVLENSKSCFTSFTSFPISTKKVKAHTKVEAFALKAANLVQVLNDFEWIFSLDDEGIQNLLATRLQRWWMHRQTNKRSPREIGGVHTPSISRGLHLVFKKGGLLSQGMMENKSN